MENKHVGIFGSGLVGTLLGLYLAKRGHRVDLFDRREDLRLTGVPAKTGRSINMALSLRGIEALKEVGAYDEVEKVAIPMQGRMIHDPEGRLTFQPYGPNGECIYSVSRAALNVVLMDLVEKQKGVQLHFNRRCLELDFANNEATIFNTKTNGPEKYKADWIFGADGAFSSVRSSMVKTDRFDYSQSFIEHGYKEFTITPGPQGEWRMFKNALHIWPRGHFMMIALPNPDGSFTCTLFFPFEGLPSFQSIDSRKDVEEFFLFYFRDLIKVMPDFVDQYFAAPANSLVTISCFPWMRGNSMLIGDAAHAIVPFYGQGMNCGFEDVRLMAEMLDQGGDWKSILNEFQFTRKVDTDAIAQLALDNFIEMRDKVANPAFLLRKQIEARLHRYNPNIWIPMYSMVTFSHMPYSEAQDRGAWQDAILDNIMDDEELNEILGLEEFEAIVWEKYVSPAINELNEAAIEIEMQRVRV